MQNPSLILASRSPQRARLLSGLGVAFTVKPAHVDETPLKNEAPLAYVTRVARAKAAKIAAENPGHVVLAADTPVFVGRRILQTPETPEEAAQMLRLQSGRRVHIASVVAVVNTQGTMRHAVVDSWLKFKRLSEAEIAQWCAREEHYNTAGGLKIEHPVCGSWVTCLHGSISGIIGLPLYETTRLLAWAGVKSSPAA